MDALGAEEDDPSFFQQLHYEVRRQISKMLPSEDAMDEFVDDNGERMLHTSGKQENLIDAVKERNVPLIIQLMADPQTDPVAWDLQGETALHYAVRLKNQVAVFTLLEEGRKYEFEGNAVSKIMVRTPNFYLQNPVHVAASDDNMIILTRLLQETRYAVRDKDFRYNTPLHIAAAYGNFEAVKILLQYKALRNIHNKSLHTPCDVAEYTGYDENFLRLLRPVNDKGFKKVIACDENRLKLSKLIYARRVPRLEDRQIVNTVFDLSTSSYQPTPSIPNYDRKVIQTSPASETLLRENEVHPNSHREFVTTQKSSSWKCEAPIKIQDFLPENCKLLSENIRTSPESSKFSSESTEISSETTQPFSRSNKTSVKNSASSLKYSVIHNKQNEFHLESQQILTKSNEISSESQGTFCENHKFCCNKPRISSNKCAPTKNIQTIEKGEDTQFPLHFKHQVDNQSTPSFPITSEQAVSSEVNIVQGQNDTHFGGLSEQCIESNRKPKQRFESILPDEQHNIIYPQQLNQPYPVYSKLSCEVPIVYIPASSTTDASGISGMTSSWVQAFPATFLQNLTCDKNGKILTENDNYHDPPTTCEEMEMKGDKKIPSDVRYRNEDCPDDFLTTKTSDSNSPAETSKNFRHFQAETAQISFTDQDTLLQTFWQEVSQNPAKALDDKSRHVTFLMPPKNSSCISSDENQKLEINELAKVIQSLPELQITQGHFVGVGISRPIFYQIGSTLDIENQSNKMQNEIKPLEITEKGLSLGIRSSSTEISKPSDYNKAGIHVLIPQDQKFNVGKADLTPKTISSRIDKITPNKILLNSTNAPDIMSTGANNTDTKQENSKNQNSPQELANERNLIKAVSSVHKKSEQTIHQMQPSRKLRRNSTGNIDIHLCQEIIQQGMFRKENNMTYENFSGLPLTFEKCEKSTSEESDIRSTSNFQHQDFSTCQNLKLVPLKQDDLISSADINPSFDNSESGILSNEPKCFHSTCDEVSNFRDIEYQYDDKSITCHKNHKDIAEQNQSVTELPSIKNDSIGNDTSMEALSSNNSLKEKMNPMVHVAKKIVSPSKKFAEGIEDLPEEVINSSEKTIKQEGLNTKPTKCTLSENCLNFTSLDDFINNHIVVSQRNTETADLLGDIDSKVKGKLVHKELNSSEKNHNVTFVKSSNSNNKQNGETCKNIITSECSQSNQEVSHHVVRRDTFKKLSKDQKTYQAVIFEETINDILPQNKEIPNEKSNYTLHDISTSVTEQGTKKVSTIPKNTGAIPKRKPYVSPNNESHANTKLKAKKGKDVNKKKSHDSLTFNNYDVLLDDKMQTEKKGQKFLSSKLGKCESEKSLSSTVLYSHKNQCDIKNQDQELSSKSLTENMNKRDTTENSNKRLNPRGSKGESQAVLSMKKGKKSIEELFDRLIDDSSSEESCQDDTLKQVSVTKQGKPIIKNNESTSKLSPRNGMSSNQKKSSKKGRKKMSMQSSPEVNLESNVLLSSNQKISSKSKKLKHSSHASNNVHTTRKKKGKPNVDTHSNTSQRKFPRDLRDIVFDCINNKSGAKSKESSFNMYDEDITDRKKNSEIRNTIQRKYQCLPKKIPGHNTSYLEANKEGRQCNTKKEFNNLAQMKNEDLENTLATRISELEVAQREKVFAIWNKFAETTRFMENSCDSDLYAIFKQECSESHTWYMKNSNTIYFKDEKMKTYSSLQLIDDIPVRISCRNNKMMRDLEVHSLIGIPVEVISSRTEINNDILYLVGIEPSRGAEGNDTREKNYSDNGILSKQLRFQQSKRHFMGAGKTFFPDFIEIDQNKIPPTLERIRIFDQIDKKGEEKTHFFDISFSPRACEFFHNVDDEEESYEAFLESVNVENMCLIIEAAVSFFFYPDEEQKEENKEDKEQEKVDNEEEMYAKGKNKRYKEINKKSDRLSKEIEKEEEILRLVEYLFYLEDESVKTEKEMEEEEEEEKEGEFEALYPHVCTHHRYPLNAPECSINNDDFCDMKMSKKQEKTPPKIPSPKKEQVIPQSIPVPRRNKILDWINDVD